MNDFATRTAGAGRPDQIAVDLPYRGLVIDFLNGTDAESALPDESDETLQLGLINLQAAGRTAAKIMDRWGERIPIKPRPGLPVSKLTSVERILDGIRIGLGETYGGLYPDMGKVREANIGGLPHIGSGWEYPERLQQTAETENRLKARPPTGEPVVVGMIDSPVAPHSALAGRWTDPTGLSSAWELSSVYPWLRGHGTFVAGGILSQAPGASLEVYGVLEGDVPTSTVWDVAKAMAAVANSGIEVLNCSVGCFTADGQPPFILARAVQVLKEKGVAVIAAAGNHGEGKGPYAPNSPIFPAACPGAIAVGAFEDATSGQPASFSPRAPWIALGAPGSKVGSTYLAGHVEFSQLPGLPPPPAPGWAPFTGFATWSGTSFATATVSGEIARLMAKDKCDAMTAVTALRQTDPATNDGIGWYSK